jgi:hypothetical protein
MDIWRNNKKSFRPKSVKNAKQELCGLVKTKMAHQASGMTEVEYPTNALRKCITWIDDAKEIVRKMWPAFRQSWIAKYWISIC